MKVRGNTSRIYTLGGSFMFYLLKRYLNMIINYIPSSLLEDRAMQVACRVNVWYLEFLFDLQTTISFTQNQYH
jgi:hypothetical protein